ncbi:MAG: T9SS type A sorting domain-containing protein [Bacteroidota bacterium]
MLKKYTAGLFLFLFVTICFCQTTNFTTFSFTARIDNVTTGENNTVVETQIPDIGIVYGKRVLNARDGHISLITARESDEKIYITTNTGSGMSNLVPLQDKEASINTFPNPFETSFLVDIPEDQHIHTLKVFDLNSRLIKQQAVTQQKPLRVNLERTGKGLYLLQLTGKV